MRVRNLGTTEWLKNSVCEQRVTREPAVADEEAGAIADPEQWPG